MSISSYLAVFISLFGGLFASAPIRVTGDAPWIQDYLTPVPDFPQKGVTFQWYANLLKDPKAFHLAIQTLAERYRDSEITGVVGLDSRGFIFGAALAYELEVPFIMVRKPGKLPRSVERIEYSLEYGKNSFEIEVESLSPGDRVVVVDDVLATGGTARAASELVERLGAEVVEVACLIEISALDGRKQVARPVYSLIAIEAP